jgi:hypothetical protein
MSTPEQHIYNPYTRYRAGLPARDASEAAAFRKWAELDAAHHQSGLDELAIDQARENYTGSRSYKGFRAEHERNAVLRDLKITDVALPRPYHRALGAGRAERLKRQTEDKMVALVLSPQDPEERAARARRFGAVGCAPTASQVAAQWPGD